MIELVPDITVVYHAIIFLLVVLIMSKLVFNPLVKLFRRREFETKAKSREASILNRKSDICDSRREKIIDSYKKSADEYRDVVISEARQSYKSKIDKTRKSAQEIATLAEAEVQKEIELFISKAKGEEDVMAEAITKKIISEGDEFEN